MRDYKVTMRFYKDLYVGENAKKKIRKIKNAIVSGKAKAGVYVISLSACSSDLLDIMPAFMLHASRYRKLEILGVAVTKEEALEVGRMIIMDVYEKTGGFDVHSYFGK